MAPLLLLLLASAGAAPGNCSVYDHTVNSMCGQNCGRCFNPGSRAGVLCNQTSTSGYLCQDEAFACMDWTLGSNYLQKAEAVFKAAEGESVYFGVGSFGSSDPMGGLAACYRLKVEGVDRDLILQSINTGPDVQGNQFDLQVGAGGFGANNKCAGGSNKMYPGSITPWGKMYGGVATIEDCDGLPKYPTDASAMQAAGDDLISLCKYSFNKKVRLSDPSKPSNPTITDLARVKCPPALAELTQLQRTDDPPGYTGPSLPGFPNTGSNMTACQHNAWDLSYCLTRMMDCCKPSAGWTNNVDAALMSAGKKVVQTCTSDGYTKIDVQCGCFDCDC